MNPLDSKSYWFAMGCLAVLVMNLLTDGESWLAAFTVGPWVAMNFWVECYIWEYEHEPDI